MNISTLESWIGKKNPNGEKKPVVIVGPCSAETPEQLLSTCQGLVDSGIDI